jgi:hypothetical protein
LDPSQLLRQAETISDLIQQRDYLHRRVAEERSRWESEKEGWDRMSEALLARRNRQLNGPDESVRAARIALRGSKYVRFPGIETDVPEFGIRQQCIERKGSFSHLVSQAQLIKHIYVA